MLFEFKFIHEIFKYTTLFEDLYHIYEKMEPAGLKTGAEQVSGLKSQNRCKNRFSGKKTSTVLFHSSNVDLIRNI